MYFTKGGPGEEGGGGRREAPNYCVADSSKLLYKSVNNLINARDITVRTLSQTTLPRREWGGGWSSAF